MYEVLSAVKTSTSIVSASFCNDEMRYDDRSFFAALYVVRECMALLRECRALLRIYRAL